MLESSGSDYIVLVKNQRKIIGQNKKVVGQAHPKQGVFGTDITGPWVSLFTGKASTGHCLVSGDVSEALLSVALIERVFLFDFQKVKSVTKPDYPFLRMEDCADCVDGASYITKLDLLKDYWQMPLTELAKNMSALVMSDDFLQYRSWPLVCVMPWLPFSV